MITPASERPDVVLIGAGIMSATLGAVLKEVEPKLNVVMFGALIDCAQESSEAWNNAGTGHAANCELNYTPQRPDGSIDISKALEANTEFDLSRQLWAHLVAKGAIPDPRAFLRPCPHMSFVWGEENAAFLQHRYKEMSAHHCYRGMEYSEDHAEIAEWAALIMEGRDEKQPVAATRMITGADVDYGALTHLIVAQLKAKPGFSVHYRQKVSDLTRSGDGRWRVTVEDSQDGETASVSTRFVFVGAGGGALELLEKSGIPEGHGYGGFPVSGIWLRCDVDEVSARHHAKVYGKAVHGSPPMSVPHLDTRIIGGKRSLLFGPYAGFSTKFLKLPFDRTRQRAADAGGRARRLAIERIFDRPGASDRGASIRDAEAILPSSAAAWMAGGGCRPARADHQTRSGAHRRARIRHRTGRQRRQVVRRPARRLAWRVHRRIHRGRGVGEVLRERTDDGPLAGPADDLKQDAAACRKNPRRNRRRTSPR